MKHTLLFRMLGWWLLACLMWGVNTRAAESLPPTNQLAWLEVTGLVARVFMEELHRAPDAEGLKVHAELLVQQGHGEAWLRSALHNSREAQAGRMHARAQRTYRALLLCCAVGLLLVGCRAKKLVRRLQEHSPELYAYLKHPARLMPVSVLLMALYAYENVKATAPESWCLTAVLVLLGLHLMRLPRWFIYGTWLSALIGIFGFYVFIDAQGPQDDISDRNEAVEIATGALLHGENPWNSKSILGLPITTGPSSILTAIPAVKLTGRINLLTFSYWSLFLVLLLAGDLLRRNESFVTLGLLLLFPWMGFLHTLHWSLEELYYAAILLPLLWALLSRRWLFWAGVLMGFMFFSRLAYVYGLVGVGLWWLWQSRENWRDVWRIVTGATVYIAVTLLIFYFIGGHDFLTANFWKNSQMSGLASDANWLAASLSWLRNLAQPPLAYLLVCLLLLPVSWLLRRVSHPFYHFALGSFLAITVAFAPPWPADYILLMLIPLLYGVAYHERLAPQR